MNDANADSDNHGDETATLPIVGIGASAGGVVAMQSLFRGLGEPDAAFVIVSHRAPQPVSKLKETLEPYTRMPILEPADGEKLAPRTVYVVPPRKAVTFSGGSLHVADIEESSRLSPIDQLFRSLASAGQHAMAVVLSGSGQDGCLGVKDVKASGGMVLVQHPGTAPFAEMPNATLASVPVDTAATPEQLGPAIARLLQLARHERSSSRLARELDERLVDQVLTALLDATGHDFTSYKRSTLSRRIQRRIRVLDLTEPEAYLQLVKKRPKELTRLFNELLIGVTSFFRDPEAFQQLSKAFDEYLRGRESKERELRVWVPACSTGEEAYSVAIVIRECLERTKTNARVQIFGTDLDPAAVQVARTGRYPIASAVDISNERLSRFFVPEDGTLRVNKAVREMLVFAPQNLVKDPPFTSIDLLSCRNMLIYFKPELQQKVLSLFHYTLLPKGLLFLGSSESLGSFEDSFRVIDKRWKIFANREPQRNRRMTHLRLDVPTTHALPSESSLAGSSKYALSAIVDRILLAGVPPSVLVTPRGRILYIHGRTGKFLEPPAGEPNANVFGMAREGLRLELPAAIRETLQSRQPLVRRGLQVRTNGGFEEVTLSIRPLSEPEPVAGTLLVSFETHGAVHGPAKKEGQDAAPGSPQERLRQLEIELEQARENLQWTIEEFETSNEELKSMNEELQSTNEELQSANEELETSREEMQSMNEELQAVNAELQDRNEDLSQINDDMQNLLNSTDVATLFLDRNLKIKRFTAPARKVFHLRDSDVGRPLADMAASLLYERLIEDARQVLASLVYSEQEVQTTDGIWRLMRILPYRTANDVIDGLVITFLDIDQLKQAEQQAQRSRSFTESILSSLSESVLVADHNGRIVSANAVFCRTFSLSEDAIRGERIVGLGTGWNHPALQSCINALTRGEAVIPVRLRGCFGSGAAKDILIRGSTLPNDETQGCFVLVIEDIQEHEYPAPIEFS